MWVWWCIFKFYYLSLNNLICLLFHKLVNQYNTSFGWFIIIVAHILMYTMRSMKKKKKNIKIRWDRWLKWFDYYFSGVRTGSQLDLSHMRGIFIYVLYLMSWFPRNPICGKQNKKKHKIMKKMIQALALISNMSRLFKKKWG